MLNIERFYNGLQVVPVASLTASLLGELQVSNVTDKLYFNNGTINDAVVTEADTATLTNKTISGASNTITNVSLISSVTNTLPIANGGTNVTSATTTATALSFAAWDANENLSANNFLEGYTTTATSGTTYVLTAASSELQYFTGSNPNQAVTMPDVSTLALGQSFTFVNNSISLLNVASSGLNNIKSMNSGYYAIFTVVATTGTSASSWSVVYAPVQIGDIGTVSSVALSVPSFLSVSGSPITGTGTLAVTLSGTALPVANGGTGITTTPSNGEIPIGNGTDYTAATLTAGTGISISNGSGSITITSTGAAPTYKAPTIQQFLSGSGTYTTPTSPAPLYIRIVAVGGGGGGASSANSGSATSGTAGGNTTFGTSLIVCNGGGGANGSGNPQGGQGGSASYGSLIGQAIAGGDGSGGNLDLGTLGGSAVFGSGLGSSSPFGGAGGSLSGGGTNGSNASTNSGSGGGGGGNGSAVSGGGGGAGGYVDALITSSIASTYSYVVGAAGVGGVLAGNDSGGNGGSGQITVYEYYQ